MSIIITNIYLLFIVLYIMSFLDTLTHLKLIKTLSIIPISEKEIKAWDMK